MLSINKTLKIKAQGFGVLSKESDNKHFLGILFNSRIFPHVSPKDKELFTVIIGGGVDTEELCDLEYDTLENLVLKRKKKKKSYGFNAVY